MNLNWKHSTDKMVDIIVTVDTNANEQWCGALIVLFTLTLVSLPLTGYWFLLLPIWYVFIAAYLIESVTLMFSADNASLIHATDDWF